MEESPLPGQARWYMTIQRISLCIAIMAIASVAASPFAGPWSTLDGKQKTLFQDGKPVLFDFWASWCVPCRIAVPGLNALAEDNPNIHLVGVITDDPGDFEQARSFITKTKMAYPSIIDIPEKLSDALQVEALPTLLLLDAKGKELGRWIGEPDDLQKQIEVLLKTK